MVPRIGKLGPSRTDPLPGLLRRIDPGDFGKEARSLDLQLTGQARALRQYEFAHPAILCGGVMKYSRLGRAKSASGIAGVGQLGYSKHLCVLPQAMRLDRWLLPGSQRIERSGIMAVPKFKMSRSNTRSRRSQWKAEVPNLQTVRVQGREVRIPRKLAKAYKNGLLAD